MKVQLKLCQTTETCLNLCCISPSVISSFTCTDNTGDFVRVKSKLQTHISISGALIPANPGSSFRSLWL